MKSIRKTPRTMSTLALLLVLAACGSDTAPPAAPPPDSQTHPPLAMPGVATPPAATPEIVQTHPRGVFFDRRPLQAAVAQTATASRPSAEHMQPATVIDSTGFGQPMPAMTLSIPAGWTGRGGVEWNRTVECGGNTHALNWTATSPDGLHEFSLLPKFTWQVESSPAGVVPLNPCPAAAMRSAREYLEFLALNSRRGVQVLDYRPRQDIVALMQAGAAQGGPQGANLSFDAGELLIGYTLGGHVMRESLVGAVTLSEMQGTIVAWSDTGIGLRAPDGLLDFEVLERIRQSMRTDRAWADQMLAWTRQHIEAVNQRQVQSIQEWHNRRMAEINMAGMTARHQIRMDTIAQIGAINNQVFASTSASNSRNHEMFKDYIQEVQPWRDPTSGQQVDLSIHYSQAWQLADGRQFLTNDPSFDPNRDLGMAGYRLEAVR